MNNLLFPADFFQKIKQKIVKPQKYQFEMLVNFIICGTQKGGTSALDSYLREHEDICMAKKKEVHFFDRDHNFKNKDTDYSIYHSSFSPNSTNRLIGEATPIYMYWPDTARRIWEYNPNMKLIVLLRNPIERAYSHWNMERNNNNEHLSFWDALRKENERCSEISSNQQRRFSYINRGFYSEQLKRLWKYFPISNTLILKSEYLKNEPVEALKDVCDFFEVKYFESLEVKIVNKTQYKSKISFQERKYLQDIFKDEIHNLERLLGWDCSEWLSE